MSSRMSTHDATWVLCEPELVSAEIRIAIISPRIGLRHLPDTPAILPLSFSRCY